MEEGLQGLLMGAVLVMFLIAMESALQVVDSSEALEQTVEERMMEQRTITVQRISDDALPICIAHQIYFWIYLSTFRPIPFELILQ